MLAFRPLSRARLLSFPPLPGPVHSKRQESEEQAESFPDDSSAVYLLILCWSPGAGDMLSVGGDVQA